MKCEICKGETLIFKDRQYQYKESGLDNVYLINLEVQVCSECGEESPFIPRILDLHAEIARTLALQPMPLRGQDLRFLRKHLGMRAKNWAGLVRVDVATLSRWENGEQPIGAQSDLLFRFLYIRLNEEREGRSFPAVMAEKIAAISSQHVGTPIMVMDVHTMRASWQPSLEDMLVPYEADMNGAEEMLTASLPIPQRQLETHAVVSSEVERPTDSRGPLHSDKAMIKAA